MEQIFAAEAANAASNAQSGFWQLAMVLMGIGLLGIFTRWRKSRPGPVVRSAKEWRALDDDPDQYRSEKDKALVDLLETTREITAQVDTKVRLLNSLIREAENKITRLEKLLAVAAPAQTMPVEQQPARTSARQKTSTMTGLQQRIMQMHAAGKTLEETASELGLSVTEVKLAIDAAGA